MYLWPVGFHAPDYTFTVLYNGKPVPNAAVQLTPYVYGGATGNNQNPDVISYTYAEFGAPDLSGVTDANGQVTFAGASLVLGGEYYAEVEPVVFEGVQLRVSGTGLDVGYSNTALVINMTNVDLVPGGNRYGLYVTNISNSVNGQVDATGTLTIVFSRPVVLHTSATQLFAATETSPVGVLATPPVNATLSSDGLTLTLTPSSWSPLPGAGETNTSITYSDGGEFLTVVGYPAGDTFEVFGTNSNVPLYSAAGAISGTVNLTAQ